MKVMELKIVQYQLQLLTYSDYGIYDYGIYILQNFNNYDII